MFRVVGKAFRELWLVSFVVIHIIAGMMGVYQGTWVETATGIAALALMVWLVLFAIGVARGEPNP